MKRETITVSQSYQLAFTRGIFQPDNDLLADAILSKDPAPKDLSKTYEAVCYIDQGFFDATPDLTDNITAYFDTHDHIALLDAPQTIIDGEAGKTETTVQDLYKHMLNVGLDRHSVVIAIGGGAALDTIGYAAATFHRGIRIIRLPTTVLAQNDAGIGVKNGINAFGIKNLLGCFTTPDAVLNDYDFLQTLPEKERRSGIAEAIKVALIRDPVFFDWIEENANTLLETNSKTMEYLIERCAELHLNQIVRGGDPFEKGSARPLDYGHWSAHKLEVLSNYELRHGEAVAIGMVLDAQYANLTGQLSEKDLSRIVSLCENLGFNIWHSALEAKNAHGDSELLAGLEEFRQHLGGDLCITLLQNIGTAEEVSQIDSKLMIDARDLIKQRFDKRHQL